MLDSLAALRRAVLGALSRVAFLGPLLARLSVGIMFAQSGWGKLHNLQQVTEFFASLGIPHPELQAPFVAGVEFIGGWLVLLGLATRLAAIPLIITMIVAIITAKLGDVEGIADVFALSEFTYLAVLAWLALAGPGPISIDALLARFLFRETASLPAENRGPAAPARGAART